MYRVALFNWSNKYCIGVSEIDAQHQKLVALLNQLHEAMLASQGREAMEAVLASLVDYTAEHFNNEERMMRDAAYPEFARHKAEHEKLKAEVMTFQRQFRAGNIALTVPLMQFLKSWLKDHILNTDVRYTPYLNATARR